jgi:hypothetical protein
VRYIDLRQEGIIIFDRSNLSAQSELLIDASLLARSFCFLLQDFRSTSFLQRTQQEIDD